MRKFKNRCKLLSIRMIASKFALALFTVAASASEQHYYGGYSGGYSPGYNSGYNSGYGGYGGGYSQAAPQVNPFATPE